MYVNVIGDEDNGEMSAWYVLSSIGLYALSPGSDAYTIGAPLFERVEIDISSLSGSGDNSPYIRTYQSRDPDNCFYQQRKMALASQSSPITTKRITCM